MPDSASRIPSPGGHADDFGFNPTKDRHHVHNLHATILHLLGLDHLKLAFEFHGRSVASPTWRGTLSHRLIA